MTHFKQEGNYETSLPILHVQTTQDFWAKELSSCFLPDVSADGHICLYNFQVSPPLERISLNLYIILCYIQKLDTFLRKPIIFLSKENSEI